VRQATTTLVKGASTSSLSTSTGTTSPARAALAELELSAALYCAPVLDAAEWSTILKDAQVGGCCHWWRLPTTGRLCCDLAMLQSQGCAGAGLLGMAGAGGPTCLRQRLMLPPPTPPACPPAHPQVSLSSAVSSFQATVGALAGGLRSAAALVLGQSSSQPVTGG
jgi:hypothetical protein